ncbi:MULTISPECIES: glycosyltransferase family 4 protein [Bacillus]|uniref:Glycosyl transferase family 1 n=2 Tax=Bacillus TaxID=1386 RepID=A0A0M4FHE3_9BACI|nr:MULTISPECIES: glycosyltransferase [Bacillus]ALC82137.1 glycosyl transferase family 1 [Bacillus gobiensis]MBP1080952.1 glycosyltransferase involved in cell wall biosynthesis [Bacillus capparidis]MED1095655.1 glycosyltransferase [Bacillus capparidis]
MKILFVFYLPSGGIETLNRQRQAALKNIQCEFLYYRNDKKFINDHQAPVYITNEDSKIRNILSNGKYDAVIIASDYLTMPRFRKLGFNGKFIYELQGGVKEQAKHMLTHAKPVISRYANGLLNPRTPYITDLFNELFPNTPKFGFNNCIDYTQYAYKKFPLHPNPIIAWIGRIEDNKNWKEFLLIGKKLIEENPKTELYMFEDPTLSNPKERKQFEEMKNTLNLNKNLSLYANVPNKYMRNYFSIIGDSGGFLCITSKAEGAPYSPLEAMCSRCPVLTTDCYGVRTSVIHNQTGKYYKIGQIDDAFKQAKDLMTNSTLREQIRLKALNHVQTNFSLERYNSNFTNMLDLLGINKS